jgi:hypothetical protein
LNRAPTFLPPSYLRNPHLQTVFNSQGPRRLRARRASSRLSSEELTLEAADGTRLLAELDRAPAAGRALVIMLHGWEGSSRSSYMITTAATLLAAGFDVLRVNLRDHGDSHHLNRELFNSTRSPEVASALENFLGEHAWEQRFICGFSLGASFALRIAADRGLEIGLDGAVAICPPADPAHAMEALNTGLFLYERYFFTRWRRSLERKLEYFPDLGYGEQLKAAKSIDDLNRMFVPVHTIYETVEEYFAAYAVVGDRLAALAVPTTIIAAEDDPIIPVGDFGRIDPVECLDIEIQRLGGHCGFIESLGGRSWIEQRLLGILRQCAD